MKNDSNKDGVLTKKEFIQYINELKIFHEEIVIFFYVAYCVHFL